jgi:hypothetical protein
MEGACLWTMLLSCSALNGIGKDWFLALAQKNLRRSCLRPQANLLLVLEAESKEKHGVRDAKPELTMTSPYVDSRVDSNTFIMYIVHVQAYASVDLNPMPE